MQDFVHKHAFASTRLFLLKFYLLQNLQTTGGTISLILDFEEIFCSVSPVIAENFFGTLTSDTEQKISLKYNFNKITGGTLFKHDFMSMQ